MTETRPGTRPDVTHVQHLTLAMTTLLRIVRYAKADLEAGCPSVEHADQIMSAAAVYLKQSVSAGKDEECSARHTPRAETKEQQLAAVPLRFMAG